MKRNILIVTISMVAITVVVKLGVFDALLLFLLVGAVPGTDFSLPSSLMLLTYVTIAVYIIAKLATRHALYIHLVARIKTRYEAYRGRLPKRRYSEI